MSLSLIKTIAVLAGFLLFAVSGFLIFEPSADPTGFFAYTPGFAVTNPFNHLSEGDVLKAEIMTRGTRDLSFDPVSGEAEFLELRCGDDAKEPDLSEDLVIFEDYSCKEKSTALFRIMTAHSDVIISFGKEKKAITNSAK